MAQVSGTATSHVKHSPRFHGMIVTPSGRFSSFLGRPRGSFCAGILALPYDLQTTSLIMLYAVDVSHFHLCRPVRGALLHQLSLGSGGTNAVRRVLCLTSARLRFGRPRLRGADPEPSQEKLASSLQGEAHVRLADEHDRVERWWTQASLSTL